MWLQFALMALFEVFILYVPGMLLLRAVKLSWLRSLLFSPAIMVFIYCGMAIVYSAAGLRAGWLSIVLPVLLVCIVVYVASALWIRREPKGAHGAARTKEDGISEERAWLYPLLYGGVGIVITIVFFVSCFSSPDSFIETFDNGHHLNLIQSFAESGNFSTLTTSLYPEVESNAYVNSQTGYYPSAWHLVAALAYDCIGGVPAVAENSWLFVITALVFPLSILALFMELFEKNKKLMVMGSLCTLAFVAFPWRFLTFGPLFSNLLAFAIMPLAIAAFIGLCAKGINKHQRVILFVLFVVGMISCALAQPNSIFSIAVFLVPFCVYAIIKAIGNMASKRKMKNVWLWTAVGVAVFLGLVVAVWAFFVTAPFMQGVVGYPHPPNDTVLQAIKHALALSSAGMGAQCPLGLIVLLGALYAFIKRRDLIWVVVSYGLFAFLYIACISFDEAIQHILVGFWYSDVYRIIACQAITGVPLACMGLVGVYDVVMILIKKLFKKGNKSSMTRNLVYLAVVILFLFTNYCSGFIGITGPFNPAFVNSRAVTKDLYANDDSASYNLEEKQFTDKVLETIPADSRIMNMPFDGSVFAYGYNGADVFYRAYGTNGMAANGDLSTILSTRLKDLATDQQVREVVDGSDIDYVLLLDCGTPEEATLYTFANVPDTWAGINGITESTPGFELVLSEGDMRLYRILSAEETAKQLNEGL